MSKKKEEIFVLLGEEVCMAMDYGIKEAAKSISDGTTYDILHKEFDTEAEKDAYIEGLLDMTGWNDFVILNKRDLNILKNEL